jgi:hypothetical protein
MFYMIYTYVCVHVYARAFTHGRNLNFLLKKFEKCIGTKHTCSKYPRPHDQLTFIII